MADSITIPQATVDRYLAGDNRHQRMIGEMLACFADIENNFAKHQMLGTMGFLMYELHGAGFLTDQEYAYEKGSLETLAKALQEGI